MIFIGLCSRQHALGKGGVVSSILTGGTIPLPRFPALFDVRSPAQNGTGLPEHTSNLRANAGEVRGKGSPGVHPSRSFRAPGPSVPQKEAGAWVGTLAPAFVHSSNPPRQAKDQLDAA